MSMTVPKREWEWIPGELSALCMEDDWAQECLGSNASPPRGKEWNCVAHPEMRISCRLLDFLSRSVTLFYGIGPAKP